MNESELRSLLGELTLLRQETEWVEFKHDKAEPKQIGQNLSASSNSATLVWKTTAYIVWDIHNETHDILGTRFRPKPSKVGNSVIRN